MYHCRGDGCRLGRSEFKRSRGKSEYRVLRIFIHRGFRVLVPGERVTKELIEKIESWKMQGLEVQGLIDYHAQKIRVQKR